MASKVYFAPIRAMSPRESKSAKIQQLFDSARFGDFIDDGDLTAIKLHFGERGNEAYINPVLVRQVVEKVKELGGKPFLTDTNTLYAGSRANATDHIITAIEHGFDYAVVGAPVIIAGGLLGEASCEVEIGRKHLDRILMAKDLADASSMIVISHFKGHGMSGFGGAIKNLAMGCATPSGKADQHSATKPLVDVEKCIGCGECAEVCRRGAISVSGGISEIDYEICTGCGACFVACQKGALNLDWETAIPAFVERMVEYASGVVMQKRGRVGFINVLLNITPDCDCLPWSDCPIVPDIGILASTDPVALDSASYDLVRAQIGLAASALESHQKEGEDKFRGIFPLVDACHQIRYGEEIGLGDSHYLLIEMQ